MNELQYCILRCLSVFRTDRTVYATFHLLKGRKGTQTIQDAKLYKLEEYFGLFPYIKREEYNQLLIDLKKEKYILPFQEQFVQITEKAEGVLVSWRGLPNVNGFLYGEYAMLLWKRLSLIVQTISHMQREIKY